VSHEEVQKDTVVAKAGVENQPGYTGERVRPGLFAGSFPAKSTVFAGRRLTVRMGWVAAKTIAKFARFA
jgi:hypothetical protein